MKTIDPKSLHLVHGLPPIAVKGDKVAYDTEWFRMEKRKLHRPHGTFAFLGCTFDGQTVYWIGQGEEEFISQFLHNINEAVWVGQNFKFDIVQLRKYAHIPQRTKLWDTMLIEQIRYSGYYNDFGLADLARRYLDVYMEKETREEFSEGQELTQDQLEYAAVDVVATWRVYKEQRSQIDETDLDIWKNIELPFLWVLLGMGGVKLDSEKWLALADSNKTKAVAIQEKYSGEGLNLNSPKQVKEYIYKQFGAKLESTDVDALEKLASGDEDDGATRFANELLVYRTFAKRSSTYGQKFVEDYVEQDGRIYGDIFQMGAECLPKGELVLTNRGYIPVENVNPGDQVISHKGKVRKVIEKSFHLPSPIHKVFLTNGLSLRTTFNHPYLLADGSWKCAKDLVQGDVVVVHSSYEMWTPIKNWEGYVVSTWGRVKNIKSGKILSQQPHNHWGHLKVTLVRNNAKHRGDDRKDFAVHRLVADAFVSGKSETNNEVRHLNGIAWDNTVGNLCWGTPKENRQDAVNHGTMVHRYTSSQSKVTDAMVAEIREGENYRGRDGILAKKFGISREHVRDIRNNKKWQEIPDREKQVQFSYATVLGKSVLGEAESYGLEVEEDHSHVTGGIVTHNTGRTSSRSPNLQNQPRESEYRDCFVADDGNCMIIADWGSQEPRIAAYLSQDEKLIDALNSNEKLYVRIARDALGINITKQSPEYNHMKSTILGLFYGMSAKGLAVRIGVSENDAQEMIDKILETYPGIAEYMKRQKKVKDYVQSVYGRKIWLNKYSYQWERNALNAPIQGSAADAMKIAAYRFLCNWHGSDFYTNTCLRLLVHDEIVLEASAECCNTVSKMLSDTMVEVAEELHDGIKGSAEVYSGHSWASKH